MIYGIGTDILKIDRLLPFATMDENDPFIQKTYTQKELSLILSRPVPLYSYATRFAGKEAVFKSMGIDGNNIRLNEIEILEESHGQPTVTLYGTIAEIAKQKGIQQFLISLSYDTDYAIAYVTCVL